MPHHSHVATEGRRGVLTEDGGGVVEPPEGWPAVQEQGEESDLRGGFKIFSSYCIMSGELICQL